MDIKKDWNEISSELKKFCDEKNYTEKPLHTVMPMIIEYLYENYKAPKKKNAVTKR